MIGYRAMMTKWAVTEWSFDENKCISLSMNSSSGLKTVIFGQYIGELLLVAFISAGTPHRHNSEPTHPVNHWLTSLTSGKGRRTESAVRVVVIVGAGVRGTL